MRVAEGAAAHSRCCEPSSVREYRGDRVRDQDPLGILFQRFIVSSLKPSTGRLIEWAELLFQQVPDQTMSFFPTAFLAAFFTAFLPDLLFEPLEFLLEHLGLAPVFVVIEV